MAGIKPFVVIFCVFNLKNRSYMLLFIRHLNGTKVGGCSKPPDYQNYGHSRYFPELFFTHFLNYDFVDLLSIYSMYKYDSSNK